MHYHICIKGQLDPSWQPWFAPLQITSETAGRTVLAGALPDQAALYGALLKIDCLGLTLLALQSSEPRHKAQHALEET